MADLPRDPDLASSEPTQNPTAAAPQTSPLSFTPLQPRVKKANKKRTLILLIAVIAVVGIAPAAYFLHRHDAKKVAVQQPTISVPTTSVPTTASTTSPTTSVPTTASTTHDVTISNGGLSLTFDIAWGGVVVAIDNRNVANGLNIEDRHDTGRLFQAAEFLYSRAPGQSKEVSNPTQAGSGGLRGPKGVLLKEKGSPVVKWSATKTQFNATIIPLDFNTGKPTNWVYTETVHIDPEGVADFNYSLHYHGQHTYRMTAVVPSLHTNPTGAFIYPLVSPYGSQGAHLRSINGTAWPVREVTVASKIPVTALVSKGWIANIDTKNNVGVFYTTPVGVRETYQTFPRAPVLGAPPLGKTNAVFPNITCRPGMSLSFHFSALVSTPNQGPALISRQPPATFSILYN
jgi:hypothetical protein